MFVVSAEQLNISWTHELLFIFLADFNGDNNLNKEDLVETIKLLCGDGELKQIEMDEVADKIIEEADLDGDGKLTYVEFEHIISRLASPP